MSGITESHINNHFMANPVWEAVFLKNYPNWTVDSWPKDAQALFEKNGCVFEVQRVSDRKTSQFYNVADVDLYFKGEFVGNLRSTISGVIEQLMISAICNYEIDMSNFE